MELKVKDFEKFKAYYCGLCRAIKQNYGNLPRAVLNYDLTFLGILLDSLQDIKCNFKVTRCFVHPVKKRLMIVDNKSLKYAAACNVTLAYFKLLDNVLDDKSALSKILSLFLKNYLKNENSVDFSKQTAYIRSSLEKLTAIERGENHSFDEVCDPFADLTGYLISSYLDDSFVMEDKDSCRESIYWLGYNLGKWIYIIDAWDDLEKDIKEKKFNVINKFFNPDNLPYDVLKQNLEGKIDFLLTTCASNCMDNLSVLPLKKNQDILNNILQFGLMEKMDIVFKRSEIDHAKSL